MEHGPTWLELFKRVEVCPAMSGRDFELWQPLLALAWWLESHGARGLLGLMQQHALETIDADKDDQVSDADESLLRILAEKRANLEAPTPGEILKAAQEAESNVFRQWSPKGVANALKRYGLRTVDPREMRGPRVPYVRPCPPMYAQTCFPGISWGFGGVHGPAGGTWAYMGVLAQG